MRPRKIDIRQSFLKTNQKVSGDQELGTHIFNQEEARRELALMVILHEYPLVWLIILALEDILKKYSKGSHTAEVLADTLVEALMDWNINHKVSTITIDNCTTNDAMINHLLQKLCTKDMPLDGKVLHMRSCAHILNLIVKDGLDINDPRYKMSLVEFFFRKIYHESARFKIDEVRQNCYDLLFDFQSRCCTLNESSSSIDSLENTMSSDVHSNINVDDSLDQFEQFVVSKTSGATNLSATSELDMYLEESLAKSS
ncbi:UNVERIFIED_CONTAM: hypothetical protein Sangu_1979200 [Sesamum angustifolium]|uniref:Transposase n=1 Tax=Sesamum angustifolium TaxID=2727405 RepID=A0AAW2LWJ1_9LAMI